MGKQIIIKIIRFYQLAISPHLPNSCRFYPSCSEYSISAVEKRGLLKGSGLAIWRILRCNPFYRHGFDILK